MHTVCMDVPCTVMVQTYSTNRMLVQSQPMPFVRIFQLSNAFGLLLRDQWWLLYLLYHQCCENRLLDIWHNSLEVNIFEYLILFTATFRQETLNFCIGLIAKISQQNLCPDGILTPTSRLQVYHAKNQNIVRRTQNKWNRVYMNILKQKLPKCINIHSTNHFLSAYNY